MPDTFYTVDECLEHVRNSSASIDICEHLDTLREYASRCDSVTELGVRWVVSTWALMAGRPKRLTSFDIHHFGIYGVDPENLDNAASNAGVIFKFYQEDVLTTDKLFETDLLFIDTVHSFKQLSMELHLHANKVKKYIVFHDTSSFGEMDEAEIRPNPGWPKELLGYYNTLGPAQGINAAIIEFLTANPEWRVDTLFTNNNGLMIITRINDAKD